MLLSNLDVDKSAIIKNINIHGIKRKRLNDLGFIKGQVIVKKFESVFKNPICYELKNTLISIRNEDASNIEVEYE